MDKLVELHVHLEGAVRHETLYELLKRGNLPIPGDGSLREFRRYMIITEPKDLANFLAPFVHVVSVIRDINVAERIAYEFIEDMFMNNVKYVEARYAPHNFLPEQKEQSGISALEECVRAITRGFERGEKDFGVKARSILCGLNGTDGILDVLELSRKLKNEGVVGIDMATKQGVSSVKEEIILDPKAIYTYEQAKSCGIHRTIHAGETGGPDMILRALDVFQTERIGHGYSVTCDKKVLKRCQQEKVHFECCPWSSLLTGAVSPNVEKHPIITMAEEDINFSINSDDPIVTGFWIQDDYELARSWGIPVHSLFKANMNAAESSFLPEQEKNELMQLIKK